MQAKTNTDFCGLEKWQIINVITRALDEVEYKTAVNLETARKEIIENLDLSITDDNPSIFKVEKGGKNA